MSAGWRAALAQAGIAASYVDGLGRRRRAPAATLRAMLGIWRTSGSPAAAPHAMATGAMCYLPDELAGDARLRGLAVQLYSLRSPDNWGIGDFADLAAIGRIAAARGADFLALNPLHARSLAEPTLCSPYSPSSRLWLEPLHLAMPLMPDYAECAEARSLCATAAFQRELHRLRAAELIDYAAVARCKLALWRVLHRHFRREHLARATPRARDFEAFVARGGAALTHYADFEARRVAACGGGEREELQQLHCYLQWQAEVQLARAAQALRAAGMRLGLLRDLALGPDLDGAEAQQPGDVFVADISAGAPPDAFNHAGQCWNLAAANPWRLRAVECAPFAELLAANMRHAGALRVDHVMSLARLFWVPRGARAAQGTYVTYPQAGLMRVLAEMSTAHRCLVVGEDLGTVPRSLRTQLARRAVLGCKVLWFERDADGAYRDPARYARHTLACASNHDLPTVAGFWRGRDLALQRELGRFASDAHYLRALDARRAERRALAARLQLPVRAGELEGELPAGLVARVHRLLGAAASMLIQYALEDLLELSESVNLPGSNAAQHPNWRRRLPLEVAALASDPRLDALRA